MSVSRRFFVLVVAAALLLSFSACKGDPTVKKQKYLESGNKYQERGQFREAAIEYQNAIQIDPQFAEAHYKLAHTYVALSNWTAALQELQKAVSLQPSNIQAQVDLGNFYLGVRNVKEAEQVAVALLEKDPNNADAHALMASIYVAQKKPMEAQREFEKALELAPGKAGIQFSAGMFEFGRGNRAGAEMRMKKALELDPKLVMARMALADVYMANGDFDAVERTHREGIAADPKAAAYYKALAKFYEMGQRRQDAEQVLLHAKNTIGNNPAGHRLLADFYVSVGETSKALDEFASLTKQNPKDVGTRVDYIDLLVGANRLEEASQLVDEMLKENSRDQHALILKARILNLHRKHSEALALLEPISKQLADNAAAHLQMGIAYNALGQGSRAEAEWRDAVRVNPNLIEAQAYIAAVALQKNDAELLRNTAEKIIELRPTAALGYLNRAAAKSMQNDFGGAEADLKKAIELAPNSPDGYTKLGTLRGLQKRYVDAEKLFEKAVQIDPNSAEALNGIVASYELQKQPPAKWIARVNKQLATNPNNDALWTLLGRAQSAAGDRKAAQSSFERALSINAANADALTFLAQLQVSTGALDSAAATYRRLIDGNPRAAMPLIMLGTLEESRGNTSRAQELYRKALDLEPNHPLAANNLAYLLMEGGGNLDVALTLAQTARRGMPNNPSTADTLGWAYYRKGIYGSARDMLEMAVQAAPENATIHFHLGMTYDKVADSTKAAAHLKKSLQLAPNGPHAALIRQTLAGR